MRYLLIISVLLFNSATFADLTVPALDIDKNRVTVSGISAGAVMAHQLHIAYSDLFSGAAIISGGPYNCADNSLVTAMTRCMMNTQQALPVDQFLAQVHQGAEAGHRKSVV